MRTDLFLTIIACCLASVVYGNISVNYTVNTETGQAPISPYIYGFNFDHVTCDNLTLRRMGGNRTTGYNWENNFSNAGSDWNHSSDNNMSGYLPWNQQQIPGKVMVDFVNDSLADDQETIMTLQMAGYVSADGDGTVQVSETAPSDRWKEVVYQKPTAFCSPPGDPDITDDYVYMDEFVNYLLSEFGNASTANGVKFYALDNEPALWSDGNDGATHPRLHSSKPTCVELRDKSIALSAAVKDIDPDAQVCGPVLYGFGAFNDFQGAPDWGSVGGGYDWFIDYYLDEMKDAGTAQGRRLLDVLDLHWYSEAHDGNGVRVVFESEPPYSDTNRQTRMQAPRTLWDPDYIENSWIGEWFSDYLPLIPTVQNSIDTWYSDTKLGFTEYDHGAADDISGGIAQADVLGIFGKYGVYLSTYWGSNDVYSNAAFRLYRDYDGSRSTFGDTKVAASMNDKVNSSIYASTFANDHDTLTLVVLNKHLTEAINADFTISSPRTFASATVWAFDSGSSAITERTPVSTITGNTFSYTIPSLTACLFVLEADYPAGDLSGNCHVGIEDLAMFVAQWLNSGGCSGIDCADLYVDNFVDYADFSILAGNWGIGTPCD